MLSKEDEKIIQMICSELTNKEIAKNLCYSEQSIEYKLRCIANKLEAQTKVGIVYKYMEGKINK
ncbi:LuxR C-terminal-related transcriptional regulator [Staphylococcus equorum]